MKKPLSYLAFFLSLLAILATGLWAQDLVLKGGTVLTITNGVIENGTVIIQKGKITAIGQNIPIPPGIKVIDVTGKYVLPGLLTAIPTLP